MRNCWVACKHILMQYDIDLLFCYFQGEKLNVNAEEFKPKSMTSNTMITNFSAGNNVLGKIIYHISLMLSGWNFIICHWYSSN